jgi:hypothetical protein
MSKNEGTFRKVKEICFSWFSNRSRINDSLMQMYLVAIYKLNRWDFCMEIIKSDWTGFYVHIQEYIEKQLNNI